MASAVLWQWGREAAPQRWVWNEKLASGGFERKSKNVCIHQITFFWNFFLNKLDLGKFLVRLSIWVRGGVSFAWWRNKVFQVPFSIFCSESEIYSLSKSSIFTQSLFSGTASSNAPRRPYQELLSWALLVYRPSFNIKIPIFNLVWTFNSVIYCFFTVP